jgi:hypothetical protein
MVIRVGAVLACTVLLAGCGGAQETTAPEAAQSSAPAPAESAPAVEPIIVDVTISQGMVTPVNETLQATAGEPIMLRVDSDAADELHVHAVPEHTFAVQPAADQEFIFTVDVPGRVEVELHDLGRVVATIHVRP